MLMRVDFYQVIELTKCQQDSADAGELNELKM
jgi:hypothetical protein